MSHRSARAVIVLTIDAAMLWEAKDPRPSTFPAPARRIFLHGTSGRSSATARPRVAAESASIACTLHQPAMAATPAARKVATPGTEAANAFQPKRRHACRTTEGKVAMGRSTLETSPSRSRPVIDGSFHAVPATSGAAAKAAPVAARAKATRRRSAHRSTRNAPASSDAPSERDAKRTAVEPMPRSVKVATTEDTLITSAYRPRPSGPRPRARISVVARPAAADSPWGSSERTRSIAPRRDPRTASTSLRTGAGALSASLATNGCNPARG